MRNKLAIIILLSSVFIIGFLTLLLIERSNQTEVMSDNISEPTPIVIQDYELIKENVNDYVVKPFTYSAWIPSWGSSSGLASLKGGGSFLNSISPVWYELNSDGSLKTRYPSQREEIIQYAKQNGIKLVPAIAMFDHELFSKVLGDQTSLDRHVESILTKVIDNSYDGIDLDYESTKLSDKQKYFELLEKLSTRLHDNDKKLIVTVIAKWGDFIIYPSLKETRQVQDWSSIAKFADEIRIMAYDYTFARSKFPGPIGPLNWIEEVLKYAISKADASKFVLGIHLYSYEWKGSNEEAPPFIPNYMGNSNGDVDASSYVYSQVKGIINDNRGRSFDYEGEKVFEYQKDGIYRSLIYIDPQGISSRVELAIEYGLAGVVFWRLGGEGELLTNLYSAN